ncbi:MAG: hypothetical protein JWP61_681 [Friedmanniella sp.]|nr:hypothetical protein [Friedmanniella sp.]
MVVSAGTKPDEDLIRQCEAVNREVEGSPVAELEVQLL